MEDLLSHPIFELLLLVSRYSSWIFANPNAELRFCAFNILMGRRIFILEAIERKVASVENILDGIDGQPWECGR